MLEGDPTSPDMQIPLSSRINPSGRSSRMWKKGNYPLKRNYPMGVLDRWEGPSRARGEGENPNFSGNNQWLAPRWAMGKRSLEGGLSPRNPVLSGMPWINRVDKSWEGKKEEKEDNILKKKFILLAARINHGILWIFHFSWNFFWFLEFPKLYPKLNPKIKIPWWIPFSWMAQRLQIQVCTRNLSEESPGISWISFPALHAGSFSL